MSYKKLCIKLDLNQHFHVFMGLYDPKIKWFNLFYIYQQNEINKLNFLGHIDP